MSDIEESHQNEESEVDRNQSDFNEKEQFEDEMVFDKKRKGRQKYSTIWSKFTIVHNEKSIASCNICGHRLSYKTTVSNLKKHLARKHMYNSRTFSHMHYQPPKKKMPMKKPTLTELGGMDGLILNVVADEGEDPLHLDEQELEATVVYQDNDGHDYCVVADEMVGHPLDQTGSETPMTEHRQTSMRDRAKHPRQSENAPRCYSNMSINDRSERLKKSRIMDLQLECLEIKKYNMQMEALVLEHQLNLPRSIFTQTLKHADTTTRSTQTEVGGNNTKVFYVSDSRMLREGAHHLLSFQAMLDD
uniref:BED-type domain-containing protein n=1 Tax=Graphocephala atropunctata TaxID=36148 RepID=A0A1B6K9L2_9HEMI